MEEMMKQLQGAKKKRSKQENLRMDDRSRDLKRAV